ncbi:MAG: rRNA maturation RNase YbeY [Candidatus Magasanikbacteria bacterium RIFOXYC2_FULL_40_16]|uniref:Endoribonuclease YbeY n=3 Tax=Candidatus Magasanikiibacteriota TaxID=1752731 RepID=A0A1F6NHS5_9BACT|nr:MAG: rRNA maturation RNase YbeY [Candidatus Magasanikbacteria bacterium RIFOXYB1_FULL_40_15]OGH86900.1 MAG: rRNA maturation RNase YbeY [Candidatus Magasanikbacteria bacterium RIFOXYB2_FULL_40_13]OGH87039.1 MAG: rRNA maturation RNase YbeY [Candidatus Magasanikbacteria bacterium RIFOXYA1_FULL_40_8]OGH90302.1 MAG: rRNA maturation RNase YbeY [Candidatus Magasanikbacteria bacterium RIFOXYC2_FULL_40_16]
MSYNIYQSVRYVKLSKKYIESVIETVMVDLKKKNKEISVHLVGDKKMKTMNRIYRKINKTTDVIAFAVQEGRVFDEADLGDIFINVNQVERQAKKQSIPYKEEFARVLIHGILHLNGYDHATEKEEKKMFGIQEKILEKI